MFSRQIFFIICFIYVLCINIYLIGENILLEYDNIRDFGVKFQSNFQFSTHIKLICLKATKTLRFLIKATKFFNDI